MNDEHLSLFGQNAREFIIENKNPRVQTNQIIDFLQS